MAKQAYLLCIAVVLVITNLAECSGQTTRLLAELRKMNSKLNDANDNIRALLEKKHDFPTCPVPPCQPDDCQTVPMEPNECALAGKWKNQLQSEMKIICQNGEVSGIYNTAVGRASNYYDLVGRYTIVGTNSTDTILGWSVSWNNHVYGNSNSTTPWTGIHYRDERIIHIHCILVRYHTKPNLWQTNMIGHDDFHRIC